MASVDWQNEEDRGSLAQSALTGKMRRIEDVGVTIEDVRSGDNCALRWASEKGHLSVVEYLEAFVKANTL
jgi:hypothetical protein